MGMPHAPILAAALAAVVMMYAKDQVVGDARWWHRVMAALLLVTLAVYLWQDRTSPR
jgi:hypothetical protein